LPNNAGDGSECKRRRGVRNSRCAVIPDSLTIAVRRSTRSVAKSRREVSRYLSPIQKIDLSPTSLTHEQPMLAELAGAAVHGRVATGLRRSNRVVRLGDRIDPDTPPDAPRPDCVTENGISLHAAVAG
jgi:hypothetical protein